MGDYWAAFSVQAQVLAMPKGLCAIGSVGSQWIVRLLDESCLKWDIWPPTEVSASAEADQAGIPAMALPISYETTIPFTVSTSNMTYIHSYAIGTLYVRVVP